MNQKKYVMPQENAGFQEDKAGSAIVKKYVKNHIGKEETAITQPLAPTGNASTPAHSALRTQPAPQQDVAVTMNALNPKIVETAYQTADAMIIIPAQKTPAQPENA